MSEITFGPVVEAAARAANREYQLKTRSGGFATWDRLPVSSRNMWRSIAKTALDAAREELVK